MRIDPVEVCSNALTITPLRLMAVWLAGALGSFLPLLISGGVDGVGALGLHLPLFPVYLFVIAFASGWWALIAVPLILILSYKMLRFVVNDNAGSDLIFIFTISYWIGIRPALHSHWIIGAVIGLVLLGFSVRMARLDRLKNPY